MTLHVSEWMAEQLRDPVPDWVERLLGDRVKYPIACQEVAPGSSVTFSDKTTMVIVVSDAPALIGVCQPNATVYLDPCARYCSPVNPEGCLVTLPFPDLAPPFPDRAPPAAPAPATTATTAVTAPAAAAATAPAA